ncbi:hypothetical protein LuPra_04792 [Luteitalea pratensis]|uniref:Translocation protein TolB n=1 Tax=Luteitalea pratensis TaxID=1855912 RepID=A0A143PT28_LUTPR|nr:hypothetical protein [Luteitalea pratensis]AMY11541.1 hypothetical protein LuPra_04792 [Luteitalea pratensis]
MAPDGGHAGKDWGVERESYLDPVTGVRVTELATVGTSDNLYFHVSNFTADNRYVLVSSTRTGQRQFYRAQVETGGLVQLTADPSDNLRGLLPDHTNACSAFVMRGADVIALDIVDFTEREIGTIPGPHVGGFQQPSLSGDGYVQFHTGRTREAVAIIDLLGLPPLRW